MTDDEKAQVIADYAVLIAEHGPESALAVEFRSDCDDDDVRELMHVSDKIYYAIRRK